MSKQFSWDKPLQFRVDYNDGKQEWVKARYLGAIKHPTNTQAVAYMRDDGSERVVTLNPASDMHRIRNTPVKQKLWAHVYCEAGVFKLSMHSNMTPEQLKVWNPNGNYIFSQEFEFEV